MYFYLESQPKYESPSHFLSITATVIGEHNEQVKFERNQTTQNLSLLYRINEQRQIHN